MNLDLLSLEERAAMHRLEINLPFRFKDEQWGEISGKDIRTISTMVRRLVGDSPAVVEFIKKQEEK